MNNKNQQNKRSNDVSDSELSTDSTANSRPITMSQEKLLLSPGNGNDATSSDLTPSQGGGGKREEVTRSRSSGGMSTGDSRLNDKEKEKLLARIEEKGPLGLDFTKAHTKRRRAIRTMEKYLNMEVITDAGAVLLKKAREIVENKELEEFVETQLGYRKLLGIAPMTAEDHRRCMAAKAERRATSDRQRAVAAEKRKLSDATQTNPTKASKPSTSFSRATKGGKVTSDKSTKGGGKVDLSLRLVLVDVGRDDGHIAEDTRLRVEGSALVQLVQSTGDSLLFFDGGWALGHRIFDCANEQSLKFLKDAVANQRANEGNVKTIPWSELNTVRSPRGWILVPRPYMPKDLIMQVIAKQNPEYNTANWSLVIEGKQRPFGQHFLIRITKEDLPILKENNMKVKVGFASSTWIMDETNSDKEPDINDIVDSLAKTTVHSDTVGGGEGAKA